MSAFKRTRAERFAAFASTSTQEAGESRYWGRLKPSFACDFPSPVSAVAFAPGEVRGPDGAPLYRVFVAADSAVVKRRFAAALRTAFPGVGVGYFDGLAPPIYDTWLKEEPTPGEWLLLAAAAADWLALARSAHVLGLKGTTTGLALPSSFARTATLAFSPATFENLQRLVWSRGDRRVACCVWKDDNDW